MFTNRETHNLMYVPPQKAKTKREVLLMAAECINNPNYLYDWNSYSTCNCGTVAQFALGISAEALANEISGTWSVMTRGYLGDDRPVCTQSGLQLQQVLTAMTDLGFTRQELVHLENLSDTTILGAAGLPLRLKSMSCGFEDVPASEARDNPTAVAKYLRAWAAMLPEAPQQEVHEIQETQENTNE